MFDAFDHKIVYLGTQTYQGFAIFHRARTKIDWFKTSGGWGEIWVRSESEAFCMPSFGAFLSIKHSCRFLCPEMGSVSIKQF